MSETTLIKKITMKNLVGSVKDYVAKFTQKDGDKVFVARIIGIAHKTRVVTTQYGESIGFRGDFAAQFGDDSSCRAPQAFFPEYITDMIASALEDAQAGENFTGLEIGFDIFAKRDKSMATGYEYDCVPLAKPSENDAVKALESKLAGDKKLPALPKPNAKPAALPSNEASK